MSILHLLIKISNKLGVFMGHFMFVALFCLLCIYFWRAAIPHGSSVGTRCSLYFWWSFAFCRCLLFWSNGGCLWVEFLATHQWASSEFRVWSDKDWFEVVLMFYLKLGFSRSCLVCPTRIRTQALPRHTTISNGPLYCLPNGKGLPFFRWTWVISLRSGT